MSHGRCEIAGQRVRGVIHHDTDPWSVYSEVDSYWVLDNGALVSKDATIGKQVEIGFGSIIEANTQIGDNVTIGYMVRIGDKTVIGARTKIGYNTIIDHECNIGEACEIENDCYVGCLNDLPDETKLGSHTVIPLETLDENDPAEFDASEGFIVIVNSWHKTHVIPRLDSKAPAEETE